MHVRPHRFEGQDLVDADADLGFPALLRALRLAFELLGGMQKPTAFLDDDAARVREPRPASAAVEQGDVEVALELLYEVSQRGRYAVQQFRGFGERTGAVDRVQCFERFEGQLHGEFHGGKGIGLSC